MRKITLTFDNGPSIGNTGRILDILRDRGVRVTFFVLGQNLLDAEGRALARRAHEEGHWIGNHTMRHVVPLGMSDDPEAPEKEIGEADQAIGELAHPDKFFRPPGKASLGPHLLSRRALDYCMRGGHTVVTWNNIPRDGIDPPDGWVERALDAALSMEWSVPVIHDHHVGRAVDNVARFIDRARAAGATFVQEIPDTVKPLIRGRIHDPVETFVTADRS
jgi:peptidoglycan/xylan/chitin deacetylase (PgdA/CDA1 family)